MLLLWLVDFDLGGDPDLVLDLDLALPAVSFPAVSLPAVSLATFSLAAALDSDFVAGGAAADLGKGGKLSSMTGTGLLLKP